MPPGPVTFRSEPELEPNSVRVARVLLHQGGSSVVLFPCPEELDLAGSARAIGEALIELTGNAVVIIEASGKTLSAATAGSETSPRREPPHPELTGRWLAPELAAVAPFPAPSTGTVARVVAATVDRLAARFAYTIVDSSHLEDSAERLRIAHHVDTACIVAQASAPKEDDLTRIARELAPEKFLGVVLIGE